MKDIDEYEDFLSSKLNSWSPKQRVAFATAMVERWLHTYEKFSAEEQWGDTANLRRIVDAIWGHVLERPLMPAERAQYADNSTRIRRTWTISTPTKRWRPA